MVLLSKHFVHRCVKRIFFIGVLAMLLGCGCEKSQSVKIPSATNAAQPIDNSQPVHVDLDTIPWTTYTILSGEHYSQKGAGLRFFTADSLRFKLAFDTTIRAKNANPVNQMDWNKVLGFSDCATHHQTNSARLVWRYDTVADNVALGQYLYIDEERSYKELTKIEIGDTINALVFRGDGQYGFDVNGVSSRIPKSCNSKLVSYWLYPYFGGDETAPQKVNVHIQHLSPR